MKAVKTVKTFRMSAGCIEKLEHLAAKRGVSQAAVIEGLLEKAEGETPESSSMIRFYQDGAEVVLNLRDIQKARLSRISETQYDVTLLLSDGTKYGFKDRQGAGVAKLLELMSVRPEDALHNWSRNGQNGGAYGL